MQVTEAAGGRSLVPPPALVETPLGPNPPPKRLRQAPQPLSAASRVPGWHLHPHPHRSWAKSCCLPQLPGTAATTPHRAPAGQSAQHLIAFPAPGQQARTLRQGVGAVLLSREPLEPFCYPSGRQVMREAVSELTQRPAQGCYIHGLFVEGARWDPVVFQLAESRPKELYTEMAVLWLLPVPNRKAPASGFYLCPIYKTLTRAGTLSTTGHSTNYVIAVEIPSSKAQRHWIKRGVALICALDF